MNKLYTLCFLLMAFQSAFSQSTSYGTLETRFNKEELSAEDSTAFINQGKQKAQSLFALTNFYLSNRDNSSNQRYISRGFTEIFYVAPGDSLDVDSITTVIRQANIEGPQVKFNITEESGYLAKLTTTNSNPEYEFYLVLMKVKKKFGSSEEEVWEVFLYLKDQEAEEE